MSKFAKEQLIEQVKTRMEANRYLLTRLPLELATTKEVAMNLAVDEIALAALTAEPVMEREQVRRDHAEWSQATFGNVGPVGPLKHLSKEALEAVAEPDDLSEWADMQFLLWDAQRRAGITDAQITQAMVEKLAINKARQWPEPKDGEARPHIKTEEDPVSARRRRNRESNARARERETPMQRKARLAKNRARMAIRRKGGAA